MQSKTQSLIEVLTGTAIGYTVAVATQFLVFPLFDIQVRSSDHFIIGAIFTVVSIVRSYAVRRLFNSFRSTEK